MPAMDIEPSYADLGIQRSPPMQIGTPRMTPREVPTEQLMPIPKLDHEALRKKAKKQRQKNKKKGMPAAAPAVNVIKGFETPVTTDGEESDFSRVSTRVNTPRIGAISPALRPATPQGGISCLRERLDALNLDSRRPSLARVMSNTSITTTTLSSAGSDGDKTEMETYHVPLDIDFISPLAGSGSQTPIFASQAIEGGLRTASIHRKMHAEDFEPLRCLGKGAFGTVHLVKQQCTGKLYAQKQFKKASLTVHKRLIEQTRTERNILESVNRHPFVVKLYYAFQDHEKLYLILEYAQGGELFTHLAMEGMFTAEVAAFYMAEMVLALEHLHQNVRVIYRDLKPENCLLDSEGHLLLTDFGLSKVSAEEEERTNSILGTIDYMAPEVVEGKPYDFSVDWWGLGAIGCDLLTGQPPFGGNNHAKIQQNIVKQKLQLPYYLGPDAKDILTRLLRKEPHKRLGGTTAKGVKELKAHRFFKKIDWKQLERREMEPPIQPVVTDPELAENFAQEFTDLPLSPVVSRNLKMRDITADPYVAAENDPFGGFSFVASKSLLEDDFMLED
ncbi:Putative serine/threonine-protein kinase, active [Septoria linicola]|uniref:Serine/threonine-protein kinase, active n=1 Tax=Septoria linicola TaxID=215465 RepID=A0A9Q9EM41_9PEZI|nr:Putative serine/threonine-protein kinase, active [Septoria linicola]